jgi:hypothetical protein
MDQKQMVSRQAASVSFYFTISLSPLAALSIFIELTRIPSITEVTFSANPDVGATLGASAHLIPQVSLGVSALGGVASASVFLDLDASLGLQGNISSAANPQPCLSGNADINVGVGAQGSFFGLFDASTGKSLFDKNFPLFQVRAHSLPYTFFLNIYHFFYTTTAMLWRERELNEFDDSV